MRMHLVYSVLGYLLLSTMAVADPRNDFEQSLARWQSRDVIHYSFNYRAEDGGFISPHCGGATIRVRVASPKKLMPVVVRSVRHCAKGTSGKAIDVAVPTSIDDLFTDCGAGYTIHPLKWISKLPTISTMAFPSSGGP